MVTTRGGATSGSSPGEVGSNAAKRRMESREIQSLWNLSNLSYLAAQTKPCFGLANASACNSLGSILPNCMASGGTAGAVSWLTPKNMQSQTTRGHCLCCGATPNRLNLSSLWCSTSDVGSTVQKCFLVMSTNSPHTNSRHWQANWCSPGWSASPFR